VTSSRLIAWLALGFVLAMAHLRPASADGHVVVLHEFD
jgi:hypothetical protein